MIHHLPNTTDLRLLPETLWLEPEDFERAKEMSDHSNDEPQQWQTYLSVLAMLSLGAWLKQQLPVHYTIQQVGCETAIGCYLRVGDVQLYLIATEHVLDEMVRVPQSVIEPDLAAHFYVVVEVLEEQAQAIARGFLSYSELTAQVNRIGASTSEECCLLPLSVWDVEFNHLMVCVQHFNLSTIEIPIASAQSTEQLSEVQSQPDSRIAQARLSQWLQGVLEEGWQTIDALIHPDANLVWNTRNTSLGFKGGKLINLGMQLGDQAVVLLITVTPEDEGKIGINVQVLPTKGAQVLPPSLKLALLSKLNMSLAILVSRYFETALMSFTQPTRGLPL